MPINPNIALGFQQPQIESPLNAYAKVIGIQNAQQQNALSKFQMQNALREQESQNALNEAYKGAFNPETGQIDRNALLRSIAERGQGRQIPGIQKMFAEQEEAGLKRDKARTDLIGERMKLSRAGLEGVTTPEEYIAWHEANHKDPILGEYLASRGSTADKSRARIMQKIQQPGGFEQLIMESKLGADKALEQHFAQIDTGAHVSTLVMPKYGAAPARVVPGSQIVKTISPEAAARLSTEKESKAPPGYRFKADGSLEAIPGGPADIKAGEIGEKREQQKLLYKEQAKNVLGSIDEAKKLVGILTAGFGGTLRGVPMSSAKDLDAKLTTIKANLGFDRLQQMRDSSPTGGALGQVAVQELSALQATVASLDQLQSPSELKKSLEKIERHYNNWLKTLEKEKETPSNKFTGQDKEAFDWANANPSDPRAAKIKERLGVK